MWEMMFVFGLLKLDLKKNDEVRSTLMEILFRIPHGLCIILYLKRKNNKYIKLKNKV